MKKTKNLIMAVALASGLAWTAKAQTSALLSDLGATAPVPGADDVSQLNNGDVSPSDLNYFFDNNPPPGQTFTTGSNPNGYVLGSLAQVIGNNYGSLPAGGQAYILRIYSVADATNATLLATYNSQNNFVINPPDDWIQWSGLTLALAPGSQYAYSFARTSGGYALMGGSNGDPYSGGQETLIPPGGGVMRFSTNATYDAAFDAGLSVAATVTVNPPVVSPANAVTNGTMVTLTGLAAGPGPLGYQWQTDGGGGGALTNIPGASGATLAVDTTGLPLGAYQYAVVATNSSSSVTSSVATLAVYQVASASLADAGTSITPGLYDISQLNGSGNNVGGGSADGLSYYDNAPYNGLPAPGQTFTTGTNTQGYYLSSVTIGTGGGSYNGVTTPITYNLDLYSVEGGTNAVLLAQYTSGNFTFTYGDWLEWSGFSPVRLKADTTYAYSFQVNANAWWQYAGMASSPTNSDLYPGGKICVIPPSGGAITYGVTGLADAAFSLGLLPVGNITTPIPSAITASPNGPQTAGTPVTLVENAAGATPLSYQWQTDGGAGGSATNIPAATGTNLALNTTGWNAGTYLFDVIVANAYGTATSPVVQVVIALPNMTANLTDIGGVAPSPLPAPDISQTSWIWDGSYGNPPGLNYYINNVPVPGQTFTTGSNPQGYILSTLALQTAGHGGSLPAAGQPYELRIYSVSGNNATLYATFTSTNFSFTETDWLRWSGLGLPLAANTQYAYSFGSSDPGNGYYEPIANSSGDYYAGGQTVNIPPAGGPMVVPSASGYDATFVLGFGLAGYPIVTPPTIAPTNVVYAGSPVVLSAAVSGQGPFTYQWQSDNGTGGSLSDISGATNLVQTVSTTGLDGLTVRYALVARNATGSTTGEAAAVLVNAASGPVLTGVANPSAISTFAGGSLVLGATFDGTRPITYQWQVDGGTGPTNIIGQTNTTLTLNNLQPANSGNYSLLASNSITTANSTPVALTVYPQLAANTAPFTVNFQFRCNNGGDPGPYTGPGVPGYGSGTFWNTVYGPNFVANNNMYTSQSGLADDGATDEHISMALNPASAYSWPDGSGIALLGSPGSAYGSTPQPFSFILPNGLYNVVLFSAAGSASANNGQPNTAAAFTINGVTQKALSSTDTSFVQGNNFVVFTNVAVSGSEISGTWSQVSGYPNFGSFNGAQLQYVGPAPAAPPSLEIQRLSGGGLQLQWSAGILLQATNVTGPWFTNPAATPFTVTPSTSAPQMFYRVKNP